MDGKRNGLNEFHNKSHIESGHNCSLYTDSVAILCGHTDTDFLARILADTSDTRDFLELFCGKLSDAPPFSRR